MSRVATHKVDNVNRFKVLKKRCVTCPFSKNQTTIEADRLVEIKNSLRRTNRPFVCHDAMKYDLVCRGYYDTESNLIVMLARMLDITEFMTLEEAEAMGKCKGHMRHWFTKFGDSQPRCRRCFAPNPRCPYYAGSVDCYGRRRRCGRTTDGTGYCPRHQPKTRAEVVMRVNL